MFVLSYDATEWAHPNFDTPLSHLNGHPLTDETGVLRTFRFGSTALNTGREWLIDTLSEVRGFPRWDTLPSETGPNDPPAGVWRRCPWVYGQEGEEGGGQSWVYVVSNLESALSVRITEVEADEGEVEDERYLTAEPEDEVPGMVEGERRDGTEDGDGDEMEDGDGEQEDNGRERSVFEVEMIVISSDEEEMKSEGEAEEAEAEAMAMEGEEDDNVDDEGEEGANEYENEDTSE